MTFVLCVPAAVMAVRKYIPDGASNCTAVCLFVIVLYALTVSPSTLVMVITADPFIGDERVQLKTPSLGLGVTAKDSATGMLLFFIELGWPGIITVALLP